MVDLMRAFLLHFSQLGQPAAAKYLETTTTD